jgi:hypothetical protein
VPAQQRGRGDQERGPSWPGQKPGQSREHDAVDRFEIQTFDLTPEYRDLVAKHQDSMAFARSPRMPNTINCSS